MPLKVRLFVLLDQYVSSEGSGNFSQKSGTYLVCTGGHFLDSVWGGGDGVGMLCFMVARKPVVRKKEYVSQERNYIQDGHCLAFVSFFSIFSVNS